MFLISWNVAGWASTTNTIRACYDGTIRTFLEYTHADIVCIQECKGTRGKRDEAPEVMGASDGVPARAGARATTTTATAAAAAVRTGSHGAARVPSASGIAGWESFWCHASQTHRGFNGVVTFARDGLTWACDARPFADDVLDDEGRALVTYHSALVLVNVYVPNARGGQRLAHKLRFLDALSRLLTRLRVQTGKPVVLVGDMNVTYRVDDAAWTLRRLALAPLAQLCETCARRVTQTATSASSSSSSSWWPQLPAEAAAVLTPAALQHVVELVVTRVCDALQDELQQQQQQQQQSTSSSSSAVRTGVVAVDDAPTLQTSHDNKNNNNTASDESKHDDTTVQDDGDEAATGQQTRYTTLLRRCLRRRRGGGSSGSHVAVTLSELAALLRACDAAGVCSVFVDDLPKPLTAQHARELYTVVRLCGLPAHGDASVLHFTERILQQPQQSDCARGKGVDDENRCDTMTTTTPHEQEHELLQQRMYDTLLVTDDMVRAAAARDTSSNSNNNNNNSGNGSSDGDGRDDDAHDDAVTHMTPAQRRAHTARCCPCPYTCWDQSRNRRLTNEGTRLDYILVDRELLHHVVCATATENNTGLAQPPHHRAADSAQTQSDCDNNTRNDTREDGFYSEFDGLAHARAVSRAMAAGAYPTAPYTGAGLPPLTGVVAHYAFRGLPSTGLFVTAPQLSDHIGVCLRCNSATLRLQPRQGKVHEYSAGCMYRPPATLHAFFARKRTAAEVETAASDAHGDGDIDTHGVQAKRRAADV